MQVYAIKFRSATLCIAVKTDLKFVLPRASEYFNRVVMLFIVLLGSPVFTVI